MSFWQLFLADLKSMVRNRMALFWFLAFPVIFMLIFGSVFSNDHAPEIHLGLCYTAGDPLGEGIAGGLAQARSITVHKGSIASEREALAKGERTIVIEIPASTIATVAAGHEATIPVYYDKAHEQTGRMLFSAVSEMLSEAERRMARRPRLFTAKLEPVQTSPLRSVDFLLPGILAMALMQLGFFGAFQIVALREQKVLKALGATPLPRIFVLGAEVAVRLLLAVVQLALTIAIGVAVFHLHVTGNWLAVLGVVALGALTFTSLGYLLTCRARTVDSGQGLVQVVQFPMMFLSGIFFPVEIMPGFLRHVSTALPLTYLGEALRQVMVGMPSQHSLGLCLAILGGWLVASIALAVSFWRWE
jgi:ABC-2 type transport system permease protein